MGENTKIEWTHTRLDDGRVIPGYTFNPWIGCTKVSPGCKHCYAERDFDKRRKVVNWGVGQPRKRTTEANWRKPVAWNRKAEKDGVRPKVFTLSLGDWLDPEVPIEWLVHLLEIIQKTPHLDWLLLTKRPEYFRRRLGHAIDHNFHSLDKNYRNIEMAGDWLYYASPPKNVWFGVTVENQEQLEKRTARALSIPAVVHFLSCEPLLGPLDFATAGEDYDFYYCPVCENFSDHVGGYISPCCGVDVTGVEEGAGGIQCTECKELFDSSEEVEECPKCGHADGGPYLPFGFMATFMDKDRVLLQHIDWVICGGESGPNARPMHPDWARSLRDQCKAAEVPFFFKQWGEWAPVENYRVMVPAGNYGFLPSGEKVVNDDSRERYVWHYSEQSSGPDGCFDAVRVGKAKAGRLLDGMEHNGMPEMVA